MTCLLEQEGLMLSSFPYQLPIDLQDMVLLYCPTFDQLLVSHPTSPIGQSFTTLPCAVSKYCHDADMSYMISYNSHQIHDCAVPILTCLIQPTMIFMMQHCAISSGSTARFWCFKYTANSLIVSVSPQEKLLLGS